MFFNNLYFKINYVCQQPSLVRISCQDSKCVAKNSKKKDNQIASHLCIKNKNLIPNSNKNFKVYFLFIIFYFDKIRSNIISASLHYNSLVRPFTLFINKGIRKVDKPFHGYINNGLQCNQFKTEETNGYFYPKKDYINIFKKSGNDRRPIHFFSILKKCTTFLRPTDDKSEAFSTFKTVYKSTHYSFNLERFISFSDSFVYKRIKLIRFLQSAKLLLKFLKQKQNPPLECDKEQEKHIRRNLYKKSFVNFGLNYYKIIIKNIIASEINFTKILCKFSLNLFHLFLINLIEINLNPNQNFLQYKNKRKLEKVKFESSANQFIWYCKFKQIKVIYIFKEVLTLLNSSKQDCRRQSFGVKQARK
jgi:hypothetical protein